MVKALLETRELILRGAIRRKVPFSEMQLVHTSNGRLHFTFEGEPVSLELGSTLAARWAQGITAPPDLAKKLGITSKSRVRFIGSVDEAALKDALQKASEVSANIGELIIARVDTARELTTAFKKTGRALSDGVPIWIVYRKGKGHDLSEDVVRAAGLAAGLVDTKVAAVSETLTALRFNKRRNSETKA
jgi:hypothetical protein